MVSRTMAGVTDVLIHMVLRLQNDPPATVGRKHDVAGRNNTAGYGAADMRKVCLRVHQSS